MKYIPSLGLYGKFFSVVLMVFLLSFLTVGNIFIYGNSDKATIEACADADDDTTKRPLTTEEEKAKSISSTLTEEYLHDQDLFLHLYTLLTSHHNGHIHTHSLGDDHSRFYCPPPDFS